MISVSTGAATISERALTSKRAGYRKGISWVLLTVPDHFSIGHFSLVTRYSLGGLRQRRARVHTQRFPEKARQFTRHRRVGHASRLRLTQFAESLVQPALGLPCQ